jgi:hypothetical protein
MAKGSIFHNKTIRKELKITKQAIVQKYLQQFNQAYKVDIIGMSLLKMVQNKAYVEASRNTDPIAKYAISIFCYGYV